MTQHATLSNRELWQNALVQIELDTSHTSFKTWFRNTDIMEREGGTVHIAVPSKIVKEWLADKHQKIILKALRSIDPDIRSVDFAVHRVATMQPERKPLKMPGQDNTAIDLTSLYIDKRDNLNPRYTFDTFVIGPFNQLAHAAAKAVMERPGLVYNPLFIYGATGHGKTHLIQSVGNYFKKSANKKVLYVTSERFAVDYINAVRGGRANSFKDQYRQYDVLIMDDVQFIANTEKTQEELFHLFNALHDSNKQIVFSSDKHPALLPGFEDRLKGRFAAGMIAEIPEPDVESRTAIIKAKLEQHGFSIPDEIVHFLAESVRGNIRELEGVVNSIVIKSQYKGKGLTEADVRGILKHMAKPPRGVSIDEVVRRIAQYYEIAEKSIYEKTRKKEVVKPRQIIMYVLREEFNVSYPTIGEKLGGRDHTTVMHSCEKIKSEMRTDSSLEQELDHIKTLVHA